MERKESRVSGTSGDVEDLEAMEINESSKYSSSKKWEWSYLRVSYCKELQFLIRWYFISKTSRKNAVTWDLIHFTNFIFIECKEVF